MLGSPGLLMIPFEGRSVMVGRWTKLDGRPMQLSGVDAQNIIYYTPNLTTYLSSFILTLSWFMSHLGPLSNVRVQGGDKYFWTESFCPNNIYKCWSQRWGANMDNSTWRSYFQASPLPQMTLASTAGVLRAGDEPFLTQSLASALSAVTYVCSVSAVPAVP